MISGEKYVHSVHLLYKIDWFSSIQSNTSNISNQSAPKLHPNRKGDSIYSTSEQTIRENAQEDYISATADSFLMDRQARE
jgi:hypothetical protein